MNKYIYHGGHRTTREQATVSVTKTPGDDKFHVTLDVSSTAAAMDALEAGVQRVTAKQWREKHPRCRYCCNAQSTPAPYFYTGPTVMWCVAKKKSTNGDVPRMFCRLFEAKED